MKKSGIINQPISAVIAGLGHTDMLVVADAGLPIPPEPQRIDLALTAGIPSFVDTLRTVLTEMQVERAIIASEIIQANPKIHREIQRQLSGIPIDTVPHDSLKERTRSARAIIRTGEFSPYANVILIAGVVF